MNEKLPKRPNRDHLRRQAKTLLAYLIQRVYRSLPRPHALPPGFSAVAPRRPTRFSHASSLRAGATPSGLRRSNLWRCPPFETLARAAHGAISYRPANREAGQTS